MGYRHYFFKVDKKDVEMVMNLSYQQLKEKYADDDGYIDFDNVISHEKIYEFGKLYYEDIAEQIYNTGKPLFKDKECMAEFEDYMPYEVGKDGLLKAIEIYKNKIIKYLENLQVDTLNEWTDEVLKPQDKMKKDVEDRLLRWNMKHILDLDEEDTFSITSSWLYEHQIFNLVHLLKTIDWESETLLFYGY